MRTEFLPYLPLRSYVTLSFIFSGCLVFNKTPSLHSVRLFHEHPILLTVPVVPMDGVYMLSSKAPSFWGKKMLLVGNVIFALIRPQF